MIIHDEPGSGPLPVIPIELTEKRGRLWETLVFLFLIVPSMVLSFFTLKEGNVSFDLLAAATITRDLALVSLIAFFLWHNREPLTRIGWTAKAVPRKAAREAALGAILFLPLLLLSSQIETLLRSVGFTGTAKSVSEILTPVGLGEFVLAIALVAVVAVAEETIFRGYLILRFEALTGSRIAAAVLSAVVFSVGHGYEGSAGVVTVGVMGLALAGVYLWRRSLIAPVVMHFLQDFTSIVLLPLLVHKH
jgi:uncharacterized protein